MTQPNTQESTLYYSAGVDFPSYPLPVPPAGAEVEIVKDESFHHSFNARSVVRAVAPAAAVQRIIRNRHH